MITNITDKSELGCIEDLMHEKLDATYTDRLLNKVRIDDATRVGNKICVFGRAWFDDQSAWVSAVISADDSIKLTCVEFV